MKWLTLLVLIASAVSCKKHPEGYNLDQSVSEGNHIISLDSITDGKSIPEEQTDYIFVTTSVTSGGDTIYRSSTKS